MDGEPEGLSETAIGHFRTASDATECKQAKIESLEKKAVHLRLVLEKDFKATDIKWSLFVAAAFSCRYESCLKPFPPNFIKNGIKDMDELLTLVTDVPALDLVLKQLDNLENLNHISDILDLLFYVLVRLKEPSLKTVPPEAHDMILLTSNNVQQLNKPQYIFQVISSSKSAAESKWKELSKNHNVFYAFHGNRLENFYSMLHFGLHQQLTKSTSMGNGIYLTPELNTCIPYSHGGFGWGASCIGGHLSCVALCEVIDAPEGINYQKPVSSEGDGIRENEKVQLLGDQFNNRLQHYFVTNCDLVRVRYLLVFAKQPTVMRFTGMGLNRNVGGLRQWVTKHKLFSILLSYGLLLATVGFANNQPVNYYYNILMKKLEIALSNVRA